MERFVRIREDVESDVAIVGKGISFPIGDISLSFYQRIIRVSVSLRRIRSSEDLRAGLNSDRRRNVANKNYRLSANVKGQS